MTKEYIVSITDDVDPNGFKQFENDYSTEQELVRCKDCKHYNIIGCSEDFGWCERYGIGHTDDWFCADGKRR